MLFAPLRPIHSSFTRLAIGIVSLRVMVGSDIVVCSFYTADAYYRAHAETLSGNLSQLGIAHELQEIDKRADEDWADVCRKKIAFLARVCTTYPDKKVFWIDVDCQLLDLPDFVAGFTADLIGFQRGFGTPMTIGYENRSRFWEPCFFGVNTTPTARKFVTDAAALERSVRLKATDDYFFEESWRANGAQMSFQVIPSSAVLGKELASAAAFFVFGSSGNVADFKGKVSQHSSLATGVKPRRAVGRKRALTAAKAFERRLSGRSQPTAARLRRWADAIGVTHWLTHTQASTGASRGRTQLANQIVMAGQRGELTTVRELSARLLVDGAPSTKEVGAVQAAESFASYANTGTGEPLPLMWWARPFPGNFGDWLSPLVLQRVSGRPVHYVAPTAPPHSAHLAMIGSIGRFIRPRTIVVGTGISSTDIELTRTARYLSVRGPLTAQVLRDSGGPLVESMGDPGALLSRLLPVAREETNGRLALIRHFTHAGLPVTLPENMDEISVLSSHPDDIEHLVTTLCGYDGVVTSAMHVMIACHSYGIPCRLIGFRGFENSVHGTGMKYRDYSLGMGLDDVWEPDIVALNLTRVEWADRLRTAKITDAKLDEIEHSVRAAVAEYLAARG